jgi:hypothetical protein
MNYKVIEHKKEILENILFKQKNSNQVTFSLSDLSAVNWENEKSEFSYNGKMYDVIEIRYAGKYIVKCIEDSKEENMLLTINKYLNGSRNSDNCFFQNDVKGFQYVYCENVNKFFPGQIIQSFFISNEKSFPVNHFRDITPPPENFL